MGILLPIFNTFRALTSQSKPSVFPRAGRHVSSLGRDYFQLTTASLRRGIRWYLNLGYPTIMAPQAR